MKHFLLGIILLAGSLTYAQKSFTESYDWNSAPALKIPDTSMLKQNAVYLLDNRIIEFAYDAKGALECYRTYHKIIWVNNNDGVTEFNKVHVPIGEDLKLVRLKARCIGKDGKITMLDTSRIKQLDKPEDQNSYKIFAMEGVTEGSNIEYFYTLHESGRKYGNEVLQSSYPRAECSVTLLSPQNLILGVKSYQEFPAFKDTLDEDLKRRIYTATMMSLPGLKDEPYSTEDAGKIRVEYTLNYNTYNRKKIFTYAEATQRYYPVLYEISDKNNKPLKKLLRDIKPGDGDQVSQIRRIENYVKKNFALFANGPSDLGDILSNRVANDFGMAKLFTAIFETIGIKTEVVLTSDRNIQPLDPAFESWAFLDKVLIWFPSINKFMSPDDIFSRLGYPPAEFLDSYGLFIRGIEVNDFKTGLGEVRKIPALDCRESSDSMLITVTPGEGFQGLHIRIRRVMAGYAGLMLQIAYAARNDKDKQEMLGNLYSFLTENAETKKLSAANFSEDDFGVNPFEIIAEVDLPTMMSKAGNNVILKVGELIGPQAELYQEGERKRDVSNEYNHAYYRAITIKVPAGYKVANLSDMTMKEEIFNKDIASSAFLSSAKINGDLIQIGVSEYYNQIIYPLAQFNDFRRVINAAADFNKRTLVFTKQ